MHFPSWCSTFLACRTGVIDLGDSFPNRQSLVSSSCLYRSPTATWWTLILRKFAAWAKGFVFAPQYYDVMTLMTKQFRRWVTMGSLKKRQVFGYQAMLKAHALTLQSLKEGGIGFYAQPGRLATRENQCVPSFFGVCLWAV